MNETDSQELKTYRKETGGRVIAVTSRRAFEVQALRLLETVVQIGPKPMTIFFGGAPFRLMEVNGQLEVRQPDYTSTTPLRTWLGDITDSLAMLVMQTQTLQKAGTAPEEYRLDQTIMVLKEALQHRRIFLKRDPSNSTDDSGWYLGSADEADDGKEHADTDYEMLPLYTLFRLRHAALQALGLPTGYIAIIDGNTVVGICNDKDEEVYKVPS